ncbi:piggyBac transposable element-derived protein 3-like [Spodoptera frugiperda]|uniref:PiggyBac transposable element-derived protein 3-like n=1 Tax=Spodoptera frugiperda TaxID=7108 RepID=A0A9R0ESE8_SPOFR|nr:piggyBac transposable element-derived protein 3-like [Spodoptera frugiperda]
MKMSRHVLSTHEIADALEDFDDDEDLQGLDIYINPPCDGTMSDGDSGEEDCDSINRLNRHQLLAPAEMVLRQREEHDEENRTIDEVLVSPSTSSQYLETLTPAAGPSSNRSRRSRHVETRADGTSSERSQQRQRIVRPRKWVKRDLRYQQCEWSPPLPRAVLTLTKESEPIEFFELFFSEDVIRYIVRHTVMYAVEKHNYNFCLSGDELSCFIGILLLSGYAPLPRRRMYWETNEDTHNVLVVKSMRRNRFEEIFRYFHVADNGNLRAGDKMAKIRPLFNIMNKKFLMYAPIEKNLSIDESMIPYYGRHGCKQHIHGKPIRFGFKAWVAATRLGYCLQADLYEGRSEARETGLGEHVVTKLMNTVKTEYPETLFSVYCDNFFTAPSLLSSLQENNVKITGTARQNRIDKCPLIDAKSCKKQPRGFYDYRLDTNDNICAVRWNDNSVVTLLSNEFGVHPVQKARRYSVAAKQKIDIDQPNVVQQYNRFMGGVDRLDANVGVYRIAIRGKKWYMPILMWLIDVAVNNAALLARSYGANVDTLEFRRSIARTLLLKYGNIRSQPGPRPQVRTNVPVSVRKHSADHIILTGQVRKRCALCKNKTIKMCRKCNVNLHDKCFAEFHS